MKLLLTSAGLSNKTINIALTQLLGKSLKNNRLAFIPTASNVEDGDKSWLIDDYNNCRQFGFEVDIVDISALSQSQWQPRLEQAKVILLGGGNTFHLMYWLKKSGLIKLLPKLLETRVFVGISAGSCVAGPTISNPVQNLFGEKYDIKIKHGLGLVNFQVVPHLNSPYFDQIKKENIELASKSLQEPVYALDDQSAIVVNGNQIKVVSEGEWYRFN